MKKITLLLCSFTLFIANHLFAQQGDSPYPWQTIQLEQNLNPQQLEKLWPKLHKEDNYPYPSVQNLTQRFNNNAQLKQRYNAQDITTLVQKQQQAWLAFHNGELEQAYLLGLELGHLGAIVATHAQFLNIYYVRVDKQVREAFFEKTQQFIKQYYADESDYTPMQFAYAHISGRKLQELKFSTKRIFEYRALNKLLGEILEHKPEHVGAGLLLAGFHAEGAVKSKFLARIRYGSSIKKAISSFEQTLDFAPHSIMGNAAFAVQLIRFKRDKYSQLAQAHLTLVSKSPADDANELLVQKHSQFLLQALKTQTLPDFIYF